jgi:hypothetical protein
MARFANIYFPIQDREPVVISRIEPSTGIIANHPGKTDSEFKRKTGAMTADSPKSESTLTLKKLSFIGWLFEKYSTAKQPPSPISQNRVNGKKKVATGYFEIRVTLRINEHRVKNQIIIRRLQLIFKAATSNNGQMT